MTADPRPDLAPDAVERLAGRPVADAPKDGSMLRLLVRFSECALEDSDNPQWTIGFNNCGNTGIDEWQFTGWDWTHDFLTEGEGEVVAWLPFHDTDLVSESETQKAWIAHHSKMSEYFEQKFHAAQEQLRARDAEIGWRPFSTYRPGIDEHEALISGTYPNGIQWVEASYWRPAEKAFVARRLDPPTHWMPMPAAPEPSP